MATTAGDQQHKHRPQYPGKHPVAQLGHQRRHKDPQAPANPKEMIHEPPKKRQEALGRTPRTHSTGGRNQKSQVHPPKPQPHHKAPRERPRSTCTTHPRQPPPSPEPPPRGPRQLQHYLLLLVRNWKAL